MSRVGIVGTGAIGAMLIRAHARFGNPKDFELEAANRSPARLDALRIDVPALRIEQAEAVAQRASMLILCLPTKPYLEVAESLARLMPADAIFVCVSNGVDLAVLAGMVPRPIVKLVPSISHREGRGVSLLIRGPGATPDHVARVRAFMAPMSLPVEVDEADTRMATNVTGCGPALFACFAGLLAQTAAAEHGDASTSAPAEAATGAPAVLSRTRLEAMAAETLAGVAALVAAGQTLHDIVEEVATPGGTTEVAVAVLRQRLPDILNEMHRATISRQGLLRKGTT